MADVLRTDPTPLSRRHRWQRWVPRIYEAQGHQLELFRGRQVEAVLRLAPMVLLANLINMVIVTLSAWTVADRWVLGIWAGAVCAAAVSGIPAWRMARRSG